jgi:ribosome recycling factor
MLDMAAELISDTETRMGKSLETLKRDMSSVRTGRASPSVLDGVTVEYYGAPTPLNQLATVSSPDATLLVVQPYDRQIIGDIERGILKAGLGLNPSNDGSVIRLAMPQPTEERRRDLVKLVKQQAEGARVAVRNIRRDVIDQLRALERGKEISQDEVHRFQDQVQKLTDTFVGQIDSSATSKEAEVMEV